jgi:hypothetical protein
MFRFDLPSRERFTDVIWRATAYRIWNSDEPHFGVVVVLERVPLERADVDGVVEQHGALGGFIRPVWVVALVFGVVCGDDGGGLGLFLGFLGLFLDDLLGDARLEIG